MCFKTRNDWKLKTVYQKVFNRCPCECVICTTGRCSARKKGNIFDAPANWSLSNTEYTNDGLVTPTVTFVFAKNSRLKGFRISYFTFKSERLASKPLRQKCIARWTWMTWWRSFCPVFWLTVHLPPHLPRTASFGQILLLRVSYQRHQHRQRWRSPSTRKQLCRETRTELRSRTYMTKTEF